MAYTRSMYQRALAEPLQISEASFSMEKNLAESLANEALFECDDLGPVDSLPLEELEAQLDFFFGTSPVSSSPPTPAPSRSSTPGPSLSSKTTSPDGPALPPPAPSRQSSQQPTPAPPLATELAPLNDIPGTSNTPDPSAKPPKPVKKTQNFRMKEGEQIGQLDTPVKKAQSKKAEKDKEKSRERRRRARKEIRHAKQGQPYNVRETTTAKHVTNARATETAFKTEDIPTCSTGFTGTRDNGGAVADLTRLMEKEGFTLETWDGKTARPVVDANERIIMVLVGQPEDLNWEGVHRGAFEAITNSRARCQFSKKSRAHRRGNFPALARGISHGGGQKVPGNLCHSKVNEKELSLLFQDVNIARIAGFANGAFATWGPKLYLYYEEHFNALLERDPSLQRNWANSVWACATINYGPKTVSKKHRDYSNLPFGWCAITSLGNFDPKKGGHLVLWELKLIIEFPPGSTILLPSSAISHSNTPIFKDEQRCSFTQYTAGGLFRWVDYGCQPAEYYWNSLDDDEIEEELKRMNERCQLGLSLFSTLDSIEIDQRVRKSSLGKRKCLS